MRSVRLLAVAFIAVLVIPAACGGDDDRRSDPGRFCEEAAAHTTAIVAPPLDDEAGLEATLDFYRAMGELAPISIAEEWNQLVVALETAASLEPGNPASEQQVAATAYATEPAAYAVKVWLNRNCGVDIPITTIAPHDFVPAITTTTAPVVTTVPPG